MRGLTILCCVLFLFACCAISMAATYTMPMSYEVAAIGCGPSCCGNSCLPQKAAATITKKTERTVTTDTTREKHRPAVAACKRAINVGGGIIRACRPGKLVAAVAGNGHERRQARREQRKS
jgi:hypothetical protein